LSRATGSYEVWLCRLASALITRCTDPLLRMMHGVVQLKVCVQWWRLCCPCAVSALCNVTRVY